MKLLKAKGLRVKDPLLEDVLQFLTNCNRNLVSKRTFFQINVHDKIVNNLSLVDQPQENDGYAAIKTLNVLEMLSLTFEKFETFQYVLFKRFFSRRIFKKGRCDCK